VPAVVGRVVGGRLLLDLRAVDPAEDDVLTTAVLAAVGSGTGGPGAAGPTKAG
jgi:L-seryl-tRNA(Ser) seleniumtransferase